MFAAVNGASSSRPCNSKCRTPALTSRRLTYSTFSRAVPGGASPLASRSLI
jgi:hypothetical protein